MPMYTVAIRGEADGPTAKSTPDLDAALDWFTNAVTEVVEPEGALQFASLAVDGIIWGAVQEGGVDPAGGGAEVIELDAKRVA